MSLPTGLVWAWQLHIWEESARELAARSADACMHICTMFVSSKRSLSSQPARLGACPGLQVNIVAAIRHPNVVLFMGVCLDPPCMVTEWCAGLFRV